MAIDKTQNTITYDAGEGGLVEFVVPFPVLKQEHIYVSATDAAGVTTDYAQGIDYQAQLVKSAQGEAESAVVTLTSPLAAGSTLTIKRTVPLVQEAAMSNQGGASPKIIERQLDYLTMVCQQLQQLIDRRLEAPAGTVPAEIVETIMNWSSGLNQVNGAIAEIRQNLAGKADAAHTHQINQVTGLLEYLATVLAGKADVSHDHAMSQIAGLSAALGAKADTTAMQTGLAGKADASALANYFTKTEMNTSLAAKANKNDVDNALAAKADRDSVNTALAGKADTLHTHTLDQVDGLAGSLDAKADKTALAPLATKTELQSGLDQKAGKETATQETNGLMSASDKTRLDNIDSAGSGLPEGGNVGDVVVNSAPGDGGWLSPAALTANLAKAGVDAFGVVKVDGVTVFSSNGVLSAVGGSGGNAVVTSTDQIVDATSGQSQTAVNTGFRATLAQQASDISGKAGAADLANCVTVANFNQAMAAKADANHTHTVSAIDGLQSALDAKADTGSLAEYATSAALAAGLAGKADLNHTQDISTINGLQTALDGKASTNVATTSVNGLMSAADKEKLDRTNPDSYAPANAPALSLETAYATTEKWTGKFWIDGKKIYQKTINVGALANNARKVAMVNESNIQMFVRPADGYTRDPVSNGVITLPYLTNAAVGIGTVCGFYSGSPAVPDIPVGAPIAGVDTSSDRTAFTETFVTVYYICTDR